MLGNNALLQATIEKINKDYGQNAIKRLDELPPKEDIVSTGIMGLDIALGVGGIRKGSIVEIYGTESAGKTTLALQLCKQFLKNDMPVLYIDSERTLTRQTIESRGIENDNFYLLNVDTLEDALTVCITSAPAFGAIVIDSLVGLTPKQQKSGDVGENHVGVFSKIMSDTLPMLIPRLEESGCILIFINQLREKVGVMFGNPENVTGGRALKYYASVRLEMRRNEQIKKDGEVIGNRTKIKVVKNKIAAPFKAVEVDILFSEGISTESDIVDCAVNENVITRRSLDYLYGTEKLGRSIYTVKSYLREHPLVLEKIVKELRKIHQME